MARKPAQQPKPNVETADVGYYEREEDGEKISRSTGLVYDSPEDRAQRGLDQED